MGHRYYAYGNGRFLTRDPIGTAGGINLYGFAGNNPVNDIDPNGTMSVGEWLDEHALGGAISRWGYTQGLYDGGYASKGQLALAALNGTAQVVILAVSIEAGGAGLLRAGGEVLAERGAVTIATDGEAIEGTGEVSDVLRSVRASRTRTLEIPGGKVTTGLLKQMAKLTDETGHEFALFRNKASGKLFMKELGSVRGNIPSGSRLLAHVHPTDNLADLEPSAEDYTALVRLRQRSAFLIDRSGTYLLRYSRSTEITHDYGVSVLP